EESRRSSAITLTHPQPTGLGPPSPAMRERGYRRPSPKPLSRDAPGVPPPDRSPGEAGEGMPVPSVRFAPLSCPPSQVAGASIRGFLSSACSKLWRARQEGRASRRGFIILLWGGGKR